VLSAQAWVPHADAVMLEIRTAGGQNGDGEEAGTVTRLVLFPDSTRTRWGGLVKGELPEGSAYRFVILSNHNHCFDAEVR
jgi:hypothetical protein